jgi:hypothetical protein
LKRRKRQVNKRIASGLSFDSPTMKSPSISLKLAELTLAISAGGLAVIRELIKKNRLDALTKYESSWRQIQHWLLPN